VLLVEIACIFLFANIIFPKYLQAGLKIIRAKNTDVCRAGKKLRWTIVGQHKQGLYYSLTLEYKG
jgi:hypothetical protein